MPRAKAKPAELPVDDDRLMDLATVCAFLSMHEESLRKIRNDPDEKFPKPLDILSGKPLWRLGDVKTWVQAKAKQRDRLAV